MCRIRNWKVMRVLFSLTVILSFCFCEYAQAAQADHPAENGLELRVMTFNIRYGAANDGENSWKNRREMAFDVIRKNDSDVVGLQEALRFQIDDIRKTLPMYGEIGVAREDGRIDGEYSAILYRLDRFGVAEAGTFWLSDTPEVPGSNQWGGACVRICSWARLIENKTGRAFYMFNLHMDHVSQTARQNSSVLVAKRIMSRNQLDPFIVTGDFNAGETNPVITYLKGNTALDLPNESPSKCPVLLLDSFRVLHPEAEVAGTSHGFKGGRNGNKIDYIFIPPAVQVLEAKILYDNIDGRYPSDHYPVIARLRMGLPVGHH